MQKSAKCVFHSESGADRANWLGLLLCTGALTLVSLAAIVVMSIIQSNVPETEPIQMPTMFWLNSLVLFISFVFLLKRFLWTTFVLAVVFLFLQITTVVQFNDSMIQSVESYGVLHDAHAASRVAVIALVTMQGLYLLVGLVVLCLTAMTENLKKQDRFYPLLVFYWRFLVIAWFVFFATLLLT
jgi:hypothetical protein